MLSSTEIGTAPPRTPAPLAHHAARSELRRSTGRFRKFCVNGIHPAFYAALDLWLSGVLSLVGETSATTKATSPPDGGFTYLVEVHDSKAPATVLIAIGFDSPKKTWRFPCRSDDHPIQVIGMIYKDDGGIAAQFSDTFSCTMPPSFFWERMKRAAPYGSDDRSLKPSRFYTQVELVPGEYELSLVVHEGKKFGRGRQSFRWNPDPPTTLSDIVPIAALRDASWVLRDAAAVSPSPVVPTPLVSKNVQFIPRADAPLHLEKHTPLYVYVEVYEPQLEPASATVYYQVRIANMKTGLLVMNTEPIGAADLIVPEAESYPLD